MSGENELPMGWVWTTVADISELLRGVSYKKHEASRHFRQGTVPILRAGNISGGLKLDDDLVYVPKSRVSEAQYIRAGDVVLAMSSGSSAVVGKAAQARTDWRGGFGAFCGVLRPTELLNQRYFGAFFKTRKYRDSISELASGTNINNIRREHLQDTPIPLPPLAEQRRIADFLEEQLSRLDAGVAALKRARANLNRYRTSVLKAAVEGRLTEAWCKENPDAESASELLERILQERRERWEKEQLAAYERKGKEPPKGWQSKYREPAGPDKDGLPGLPEGWCWTSLGELAWDSGYGTSQRCDYEASGPPVLRIPNVAAGNFDAADLKFATDPNELSNKEPLAPGDLLIIRTNGSRNLIGRGALVREQFQQPFFFASYLIRFRVLGLPGLGRWLAALWDAPFMRERIERIAATSAGQYNVNMDKLSRLPIPLPPQDEQERICEEVERRLSVLREVGAQVEADLKRAARLRQSVLKRAFEGKLVPQDSTDEPASELLGRVRAERERSSVNGARRKARKKAAKEPDPAAAPTTLF